MELTIKKRLNKVIGDKKYYRWIIEVPSEMVKNLNLVDGETVKLTRVK